jgi:hypothetical protein
MKAIVAAAALLASQPAVAQPKACLTRTEAANLGTFFMPAVIDGMARKCSAALPRGAFLSGAHRPLAERLRQDQDARWPAAKAGIEKLRGARLPKLFDEKLTKRMAESLAAEMTLRNFNARDCGTASELLGSVAPLPATHFGRLFSVLMEIGQKEKAKMPIRLCDGAGA